jgi:protein SCO1
MGVDAAAPRVVTRTRATCAAVCLALAVVAGTAWAAAGPGGASANPLRGDAVWTAGTRPAPAFALTDQNGRRVTPASLRGRPWMLTFLDSHCRTLCPIAGHQLGDAERRLGDAAVPLVVVSVDPGDTPRSVRRAAHRWGWHGRWSWLMGRASTLRPVLARYGIDVQPTANDIAHSMAVFLIDGAGNERAAFLPPIAVGQLERDVRMLRSGHA